MDKKPEILKQISLKELEKLSNCRKCETEFLVVGTKNPYGFVNFPPEYFCEVCKSLDLSKNVLCQRCDVGIPVIGILNQFEKGCISYPHVEFCEPCSKIVAEERRKEKIEEALRNVSSVLSGYGLPPKLTSISFALSDSLRQHVPLISLSEIVGTKGLCLSGPSGVGKTFSMAMIVRDWVIEAIKREETIKGCWRFVNYPSFIMQVQDSYRRSKSEESSLEMQNELARVPFLIIDDLGVEKATDFVKQSTYYILNEREMNLRPTYITTNFTLDQLNDFIDPRISSRIAGMCEIKEVKGIDRRVPKKV